MAESSDAQPQKGKLPPWLLIAGGGVVLLLLVVGQRGGGTSSAGIATAEISDQLAEQRQLTAQQLADQKATLTDALTAQRQQTESALKLQADRLTKAEADTTAAKAALATQQQQNASLLQSILDALKNVAAGATGGGSTGPAAPLGPRPSDDAVREWAAGIGLPAGWGFAFVGRYGILPRSIAELESWRSQIGTFNGGQWCIGGECI